MKRTSAKSVSYAVGLFAMLITISGCKKDNDKEHIKAEFNFVYKNLGMLPDTVFFSATPKNVTSFYWDFANGTTSTEPNPVAIFTSTGTYRVKLVVANQDEKDSVFRDVIITQDKPSPNFTFTLHNSGFLPDTVDFVSTTKNASSLKWYFDDGHTDTAFNPRNIYTTSGIFNVKLIATNAAGSDSIIKPVNITLNKPIAGFNFTLSNAEILPVVLTTTNTTIGSNVTYSWTFGNGSSNQTNPVNNYTSGGLYAIKLVATNASGSDSTIKKIRISPFPQAYTSINGTLLNLYAWEGEKVMILSRFSTLNRQTMFKWLKTMDTTYNYYKACSGGEPGHYAPTYINNRTTIADVPATCGAGCGFVGSTGFEMQNNFFDANYNAINNLNQYDHLCFYEFGRNFWFFGAKLDYKEAGSFPIAGSYAVWMGSMEGRDAVGVAGVAVNGETYAQAKARFANFVNLYVANPALNWANTLAIDQGVPGQCNAADLFCSMCMKLKTDYGGDTFLKNIWKNVGLRPNAATTQEAVDNFFLAACKTANKNLTTLFQTWKFPLSASALAAAALFP